MPLNLQNFPFESSLEKEALSFLEKHAKAIAIPKNNILFYQGDVCESVLLLTKGEVRLYIQDKGVESIDLYTLKSGEQCIVNTASSISNTNAIASAQSISDIEGYLLDSQSIKQLSALSPVYQSYIFSLYTIRMADLAMLINDIKFKKLDVRLLEWLHKHGEKNIKITHEEIANSLGSSRVVISRTLKELEKKTKVILHRGSIEVL
ncbi:MAG: transcriptional regulator, Crp/Fnr family [uncultured Sulfurovum sp.]|uniref:Transcriptional regulator, Crp/Fnr family n=1 Tax=uncultured Sulfurovum sp. TaxID=269237 RepID=A0A6S6T6B8_9BACT|nr:MAG: transcriptional regulator, Crp/Fnr family [uncultured Sulfurovum sp.]